MRESKFPIVGVSSRDMALTASKKRKRKRKKKRMSIMRKTSDEKSPYGRDVAE